MQHNPQSGAGSSSCRLRQPQPSSRSRKNNPGGVRAKTVSFSGPNGICNTHRASSNAGSIRPIPKVTVEAGSSGGNITEPKGKDGVGTLMVEL